MGSKRSRKAQDSDSDFEDYDDDDMDNDNLSVSNFFFFKILFYINHSWNLTNIVIGFVFLFLG